MEEIFNIIVSVFFILLGLFIEFQILNKNTGTSRPLTITHKLLIAFFVGSSIALHGQKIYEEVSKKE